MIRVCKQDQDSILDRIRRGEIDAAALSSSHLVDDIIIAMKHHDILDCLYENFEDKRADNTTVPFQTVLIPAIASKMRTQSSLTKIPYALTDHRTLAELGFTIMDSDRDISKGLMDEGTIRKLIEKYTPMSLVDSYNETLRSIMPKMDLGSDIFMLDSTDIEVNLKNENYEGSAVRASKKKKNSKENEQPKRGYKLMVLRNLVNDKGILVDIRFDKITTGETTIGKDILRNSRMLHPGSTVIMDRGFIDYETIEHIKKRRSIDSIIPVRSDMTIYGQAVSIAKEENKWQNHPNKKRFSQKIAYVSDLGEFWTSSKSYQYKKEENTECLQLAACVIWDTTDDNYRVFVTTDTTANARQIVQKYELRVEIEEDFRQIKDFWKIEEFKSRKLINITFHIICVLLGYLFYQLYTFLPEGEMYLHKSLPVAIHYYIPTSHPYVIVYAEDMFGVMKLPDLLKLYSLCSDEAKKRLDEVLDRQ